MRTTKGRRSSSPDLYIMLDIDLACNSAPKGNLEDAYNINNSEETESTVSFGDTSDDLLSYLEDTMSDSISAPRDDGVEAENEEAG